MASGVFLLCVYYKLQRSNIHHLNCGFDYNCQGKIQGTLFLFFDKHGHIPALMSNLALRAGNTTLAFVLSRHSAK